MDLDAYTAAHAADWERLARVSASAPRNGVAADELIEAYQSGATQLSTIATTVGDTVQGDRLSLSLSRARLRFTGVRSNPLRRLTVFLGWQLPAALYRVRWLTLAMAVLTVAIASIYYGWISTHPTVLAALGPREQLKALAEKEFVGYYSANSPLGFTGQVWTNNALIAAQCVVFGITGLWPLVTIVTNAQNIGVDAAILGEFGKLDQFFLYIAPHGQLELYSIFTAAAAGLLIFWSGWHRDPARDAKRLPKTAGPSSRS